MRVCDHIGCPDFPCADIDRRGYNVPGAEVDPAAVRLVLISECAPLDPAQDYYATGEPLYAQTTLQAFADAGYPCASMADLLARGVYLTHAVKCAKTTYVIAGATVERCSRLLETELDLFPNVRAYLLMGDAAIKAANAISKRAGAGRAIPAGATYKIRGGTFTFRGARAFPSYLQAGPSFFIEKVKRKTIAEDIGAAMKLIE